MTTIAPANDIHALSRNLLAESRAGDAAASWATLASLLPREVSRALKSDAEKLAFWINLYNAAVAQQLGDNPGQYHHRGMFFARKSITLAGKRLSLNAIEHGLLRRSMFGYSLGYIGNPLPSRFERRFRLELRDARVHFALNCGALSCPPIASYEVDRIDEQLELATANYLAAECQYDPAANTVAVPRLLSWFRGDFGGREGILELLRHHDIIAGDAAPKRTYRPYVWTLALDG